MSDSEISNELNLSRWMTDLPDKLKQMPLMYLCIPGSHNSFTYSLSWRSDVSPDAPKIVSSLSKRWTKPFVNRIVQAFSCTQSIDVTKQLEIGIRYLDIRLAYRNGQFCIVHGLYGDDVFQYLDDVYSFLIFNENEIVILDFQHFYDFTPDIHKILIDRIKRMFGSKICKCVCDLSGISLQKMQNDGEQVLILYRNDDEALKTVLLWPSKCWPTPWPNKLKVDELIDYLKNGLQNRIKSKGYVTQCVLTVDIRYVLTHLCGSLKKLAYASNNLIFNWLESQALANIVICDFVHKFDFSRRIILINNKVIEK